MEKSLHRTIQTLLSKSKGFATLTSPTPTFHHPRGEEDAPSSGFLPSAHPEEDGHVGPVPRGAAGRADTPRRRTPAGRPARGRGAASVPLLPPLCAHRQGTASDKSQPVREGTGRTRRLQQHRAPPRAEPPAPSGAALQTAGTGRG